jgi:hypothetical protein
MSCPCATLTDAFYAADAPAGFLKKLRRRDGADWMMLAECPTCEQHWSVDEWDKHGSRAVIRIPDPSRWRDLADADHHRKDLLLRKRGGVTSGQCTWTGCFRRQVKGGGTYCIDHLWTSGVRY